MQRQPWFHPLISLIGAIGLLALSAGLDDFLTMRQKFAQASFEYDQLFLAQIVTGLLMFVGWTALGWYGLFFQRPSPGLCIALIILGGFVLWAPYVGLWAGQPIVHLRLYVLTAELVYASGIYITVLGGLGLLHRPRELDRA